MSVDKQYEKDIMSSIRARINLSVRANTHGGYIGWYACDNICNDMSDVLALLEDYLAIEEPFLALKVASYIDLKCVQLASEADSSSGMLGETAFRALKLIERCTCEISKAETVIRNEALTFIVKESKKKVFEGWTGWRCEYIQAGICLADSKNVKQLEEYLNGLLDKAEMKDYGEFEVKDIKVVKYKLHRHTNGMESSRMELYENLDIDELRRIAIFDAMESKDFDEAERLCTEKIQERSRSYNSFDPKDWNNLLFKIYEVSGWKQKMIKQAERLLRLGNEGFWEKLKKIYEKEGIWKEKRTDLLELASRCAVKSTYYYILKEEKESVLLMDEMNKAPDEIFHYGDCLVKKFPREVMHLCVQKIRAECEAAHDRRNYRRVCDLIKTLAEWTENSTADNLIIELKKKYPRRTALQDELDKTRKKIII